MSTLTPKCDLNWQELINREKLKPYFKSLEQWLDTQREATTPIYPPANQVFRALDLTPFANTKVVILGQDPYHGENQANGLSFSVNKGIRIPPSLRNIFKELHHSVEFDIPTHGDLTEWALQGVLMLNTVLTVAKATPQSHQKKGWEQFTDEIIRFLNNSPEPIVFLLWGAPAGKKIELIDTNKHTVLQAPHPSPLSAHRGFLGCEHFKKTNEILLNNHQKPIIWQLTESQTKLQLN